MSVSRRLRYEVLRRDNHACRYCGGAAPDVKLTVDHVIPTALGGGDEPSNLVTACQPCNAGKSASSPDAPLVEDVKADALRWKRAMEQAAGDYLAAQELRAQLHNEIENSWTRWTYDHEGERRPVPMPDNWEDSIDAFAKAGVPFWMMDDAIVVAMKRGDVLLHDRWRYFCGVVWRMADDLRERAAKIVAGDA